MHLMQCMKVTVACQAETHSQLFYKKLHFSRNKFCWRHFLNRFIYTVVARIHWFTIRGPKKIEIWRNKRCTGFKTRAKRERAVTWWNPASQMRPVLDLSSFVPVSTLNHQNPLLSYVRERERDYTWNVQCRVQYTLLLLYFMLVMSYWA
jgi:hypothetical protein